MKLELNKEMNLIIEKRLLFSISHRATSIEVPLRSGVSVPQVAVF